MMYLMYHNKIIGGVPSTCRSLYDAFYALGINIQDQRDCKRAYARSVPGFWSDADGYYVDLTGCRLVVVWR